MNFELKMIEELKKKKLAEMQEKQEKLGAEEEFQKQLEEQLKAQQQIEMLESVAKQFLTKEAVERYGRLKLAHPATAIKTIALIAQAAQLGQLNDKISDIEFKELLKRMREDKKDFSFKK